MPPCPDPLIPELLSLAEAADLLSCSKKWIRDLYQRGCLHGQRVDTFLVLLKASVHALVDARRTGSAGWKLPDPVVPPRLPALISAGQAAVILGLSGATEARSLYLEGYFPGRSVGNTVVFRAEVIWQRLRGE